MEKKIFNLGTKIVHGNEVLGEIAEELYRVNDNPKVFICTDKGIEDVGLLDKLTKSLNESSIEFTVYDEVIANPRIETVENGLEAMKEFDGNLIVAFGGGSTIDTAKAISVLYTNGGNIYDYHGRDKIEKPGVPLVAVPTTFGSGSDVSAATVITDKKNKNKKLIISEHLIPRIALLDPTLLLELPRDMASSAAIDALTSGIESYTSLRATPLTDALNIKAIEMIHENATKAVMNNCHIAASGEMLLASTMTGIAFTNTGLGLVHSIAHAIGGLYDIPHGVANSILLPSVMEFNIPVVAEKYKKIGTVMGLQIDHMNDFEAAKYVCKEYIPEFSRMVGVPKKLRDLGLPREIFGQIAEYAMTDENFANNPRYTTKDDILGILDNAYYNKS